jgi:hypothetical protein
MAGNQKKILLAFSPQPEKEFLMEILRQMERRVQIDFVSNEEEVLYYLSAQTTRRLPGLIVVDSPPLNEAVAELCNEIRQQTQFAEIPIAFFAPPWNLPAMMQWKSYENVYFYPRTVKPSECKYYLRQMLDLYFEPVRVKEF